MADGTSTIRGALDSQDTRATLDACRGFGARIDVINDALQIVGHPHPSPASIDAQNSGTTARIATAVASLASGQTAITGDASLRTRPLGPLLDALASIGAHYEPNTRTLPLLIRGPVTGGRATVSGDVSSQFVTALLMAAPCMPEGLGLTIEGRAVSRPYIDATVSVMERFGASITTRALYSEYFVAPQRYTASSFTVPSDYSALALLLAASVMTGNALEISADDGGLPQGDLVFCEILESMGVKTSIQDGIWRTTSPAVLRGGSFELTNTPDLLPPLAVLALRCDEPVEITGIAHARVKETDRIALLAAQLGRLGLHVDEGDDSLLLHCRDAADLHAAELDASGDHRIFMALCIACMYTGGSVNGAESVSVSYPGFIDDMRGLGAQIT